MKSTPKFLENITAAFTAAYNDIKAGYQARREWADNVLISVGVPFEEFHTKASPRPSGSRSYNFGGELYSIRYPSKDAGAHATVVQRDIAYLNEQLDELEQLVASIHEKMKPANEPTELS
jgi:hypothetical protein